MCFVGMVLEVIFGGEFVELKDVNDTREHQQRILSLIKDIRLW